jgi:hypothetical protein
LTSSDDVFGVVEDRSGDGGHRSRLGFRILFQENTVGEALDEQLVDRLAYLRRYAVAFHPAEQLRRLG